MALEVEAARTSSATLAVSHHRQAGVNGKPADADTIVATAGTFADFVGTSEVNLSALSVAVDHHRNMNPNAEIEDADVVVETATAFAAFIND